VAGAGGTIGGGGEPVYTGGYLASAGDADDKATYTFPSMNIGTAASDRMVLIAIHYFINSYRSVNSVNIGGLFGTKVTQAAGGSACQVALFRSNVTSGTTASISVTISGGASRCAISTYAFYGLSSQTPEDTSANGGVFDIASTSLSTTSGGLVFHAGSNFGGAAGVWTNLTPSIEGVNEGQYYSSGFMTGTGSTMNESLDAPGNNRVSLVSAAWY
jgi:hypothetical protein